MPVTGRDCAYRVDELATCFQERSLSFCAGGWGGTEIRPTRLFLWLGHREPGSEWILPLGSEPRLLRVPRRRRHLEFGSWRVSFLGNPLVTLGLFAVRTLRSCTLTR